MTGLNKTLSAIAGLALLAATPAAQAEDDEALVSFKAMKVEVALQMAQAAMTACRNRGFQVAVQVVDRFGQSQVLLRDRYAGPHTPETARRKAWTAVSFRTDTLELAELTSAGTDFSGLRFVEEAMAVGGGLPVEAAGSLVGGIGISGAPSGEEDRACAEDGIDAVSDQLAF